MDEKKLLKSLSDITSQLQNIAKGLGVSTGVGKSTQKANKLSKDELAKNKEIAKITAEEYKKTLGLNFKDSDNVDKIAKRFKVTFDVSTTIRLMYDIRDHLKEFKDKWLKSLTKVNVDPKKNTDVLIKNLGWEDFKAEVISNIRAEESHRFFVQEAWENLFRNLGVMIDNTKKEKKKESTGGLGEKLKNVAGLALIGGGIFLIVQALVNSGEINIGNTLKVLGVVSAFMLLFYAVSDKAARIKAASVGFAILAATTSFLIIPMLNTLAKMPLDEYVYGLSKFSGIIAACIGLLWLMQKIKAADVTKSVIGLGLLGGVIGLVVIPLLEKISNIDYKVLGLGLFNLGIIFGAMYGLMKLMETINSSQVVKSTLGITLLSSILSFVILPELMYIAEYDFVKILKGLSFITLIVGSLGLILKGVGKIFQAGIKETLIGMTAIVGLTFMLGYLADNLNKFASMDWGMIGKNLSLSVLAITLFGAVIVGIGALVANPVVAPLLAVGAAVVLGLSFLLSTIAESLKSFNDVDGETLISVGTGLSALGVGLTAFLVGMTSGVAGSVIGKIGGFFGLDPAAQIKKFETINAEKISVLGLGLKNMGDGLRMLSSDINLKGITAQLIALTLPLTSFTTVLDDFNRAFKQLDDTFGKSEINNVYKLKIETENNIQNSILEINKQELAIQQAQLEELRKNNELLKYVADNLSSVGGLSRSNNIINANKTTQTAIGSNFSTKSSYMNHMKLSSMTINGT